MLSKSRRDERMGGTRVDQGLVGLRSAIDCYFCEACPPWLVSHSGAGWAEARHCCYCAVGDLFNFSTCHWFGFANLCPMAYFPAVTAHLILCRAIAVWVTTASTKETILCALVHCSPRAPACSRNHIWRCYHFRGRCPWFKAWARIEVARVASWNINSISQCNTLCRSIVSVIQLKQTRPNRIRRNTRNECIAKEKVLMLCGCHCLTLTCLY